MATEVVVELSTQVLRCGLRNTILKGDPDVDPNLRCANFDKLQAFARPFSIRTTEVVLEDGVYICNTEFCPLFSGGLRRG